MRIAPIALALALSAGYAKTPAFKVIHTFTGQAGDGAYPYGALVVGPHGILYGTTAGGGFGYGTVFSLTPPASRPGDWTETILYSFTTQQDGEGPSSLIIGDHGVLYGITGVGGPAEDGTFFSLAPPASPGAAWTKTVLWNFGSHGDGSTPNGVVRGGDGTFYGATSGGGAFSKGTVFRLVPPVSPGGAWTESVLWSFGSPNDGQIPWSSVAIGADGSLYGTTYFGAESLGTVFAVSPPATPGGSWTEQLLLKFSQSGGFGSYPEAGVIIGRDGLLYGTTYGQQGYRGVGTVFSLAPPSSPGGAWVPAQVYRFPHHKNQPQRPRGARPAAPLWMSPAGILYGTASNGGKYGPGAVFQLTPPATPGGPWKEKVLHSFSNNDGAKPESGLVMDRRGTLYGTTYHGGSAGVGTIFELKP